MNFKEKMKKISILLTQVYVSVKSEKTPWYAKLVGGTTIMYALSPIDLIPDFIPVIGYLDDLIILPLLITLTIKLIPKKLWQEFEEESKLIWKDGKPVKWYYAIPIILIWLVVVALIINAILY